MDGLLIAYLTLAGAGLLVALLTLVQTWEHRRYHQKRLTAGEEETSQPLVMLFVPCKGVDLDFHSNLRSLLTQDYAHYRIRFIVEAADDPAVAAIEQARAESPGVSCEITVAGLAKDCGQKVHNLLAATAEIPKDVEVLTFADSDACPGPKWLSRMVRRTSNSRTGVVTGYRWFVPKRWTGCNVLLAAMNNQLAGNLGIRLFNIIWGGSWSTRKEVFERLDVRGAWQGSLSDDMVLTRLVRQAGLKIVYEPYCLATSPIDFDLSSMLEFTRRQLLIVRVVTPGWWMLAASAALLVNGLYFGSLLLAGVWAITGGPLLLPLTGAAAYYLLTALRTTIRRRTMRPFLQVDDVTFARVTRFERWGTPLVALLHLVTLASSATGRRIVWRGIHYYLAGPHETKIEARPESPTTRDSPLQKAA